MEPFLCHLSAMNASAPSLKICVFCGSKSGNNPILVDEVQAFGRFIAKAGFELVYGGGKVGLMGRLADGVLELNGRVTGIIPTFLSTAEVAREDLTTLEMVDTLEARKKRMFAVSDVFITIPGGFGTFDELFEAITLRQLGLHPKPVIIVNWQGFYTPLIEQLRVMAEQGFLYPDSLQLCEFVDSFADLEKRLKQMTSPT